MRPASSPDRRRGRAGKMRGPWSQGFFPVHWPPPCVLGDLRSPASTCTLASPFCPHPTCNQSTFNRPLNRLDTVGRQTRIPGPPLTPAFVQASSPLAVTFPPAQVDPESSYPVTTGPFFQQGKPTEGVSLSCPPLLSGTRVWTGARTVQPFCTGHRGSGRAGGRARVPTSLLLCGDVLSGCSV